MTVNELLHEELALGFTTALEFDRSFLAALNRAVRQIYNEDGVIKRLKILKNTPKPIQNIKRLFYTADKEEKIELLGKTLYFKLSGNGSYRINDGESVPFSTSYQTVKMHINPKDILTFTGDTAYTVYDITVFEKRLQLDNLPTDLLVPYDMNALTDDFLSFFGTVRDENGFEVEGAVSENSILYLPRSVNGELEVSYKRRPVELTVDDSESEIDIPSEYLPLLPLLVAGYLWLDDEPEKAQYYTSLYKEGAQRLKYEKKFSSAAPYNDVLRWA